MAEERVQRRLAAILAVDVVGYSRLMAVDETGTLAQLKAIRKELVDPTIAKWHGRSVKTMGDGELVEFASAVDAVQQAAEVQQAMTQRNENVPHEKRIEFRVGINVGDIIVEEDDIYGDGVNVAARLEALSDPGGICISGTAFDQVKGKLDFGFEDLGPQTVKNIPEPVRAYRVLLDPEAAGTVITAPTRRFASWKWAATAATIAVIVAVGALAWLRPWELEVEPASIARMAHPLPDRPSIVVLPFMNMSGDASQNPLADGFTEDITTDLSQVSGLFVVARSSAFTYKGKAVKVRQVAEELGVRYVLEGSVRRSGDRVRVNAQLIDAVGGHHLWAERYDRDVKDIFALQDEVGSSVVNALAIQLSGGEKKKFAYKHTENLEARAAFMKGGALLNPPIPANLKKARALFQQAIELDPNFAGGYAGISWISSLAVMFGRLPNPDKVHQVALRMAKKAVSLDAAFAWSHTALALAHFVGDSHQNAIESARNGVEVEPNSADAHAFLGFFMAFGGEAEKGVEELKTAIRLNPRYVGPYFNFLGYANFYAKRYEAAVKAYEENAARRGPRIHILLAHWAASYAMAGQLDKARGVVKQIIGRYPKISLNSWPTRVPFVHRYKYPEEKERFVAALRKAGFPEHPPLKLPDKLRRER